MAPTNTTQHGQDELRERAEAVAQQNAASSSDTLAELSVAAMQQTIHQLRVHQIELEMQNDELRRTQAALDTAQARYFDFYDLAPVGYLGLGDDDQILQANLTTAKLLGLTRNALIGQKMSRFICWEDKDTYYLQRKQLFASDTPLSCEFRMTQAKGPPCWLHLEAIPVQDNGTRVMRGVLTDVTSRRQTENSLRESEQKLSLILDNVDAYIYLKDTQGRYLFANRSVRELFGVSMEEIVGRDDAHFFDAATVAQLQENERPVYQLGETSRKEDLDFRLSDGQTLTFFSVKLPLRNAAGDIVALCGISTDITERKQAQAALEANSKFRDAILDSVPSQIAVLDRHGIIVAVNQVWRGFALDNATQPGTPANNTQIGVNYLDICQAANGPSSEGAEQARDGILKVISGIWQSFHLEYPCHSPTQQRWFDLRVTPLNLEDHGVVVTHTDITEHKQLQVAQLALAVELELATSRQQLRELVALNEATREEERKHIAREVHDELGQVLTALRMDLSLLGMRYGALEAALHTDVQGMKTLVDSAIQGVRNVATHLRPTALDMGLVSAIEWLCQEFARINHLPCSFDTQGDLALDDLRAVVIFRIAQESLTNITRYARASLVGVSLGRHGRDLRLEVRDNGCGFDAQAAGQNRSFGLLGMRERALALGGVLDIASTPGQGTVVTLTIPFVIETTRSQP